MDGNNNFDAKVRTAFNVLLFDKISLAHRYSVDAVLDESLSKHLATGKLFVGQKLRVSCLLVSILYDKNSLCQFIRISRMLPAYSFVFCFEDMGSRPAWMDWPRITP